MDEETVVLSANGVAIVLVPASVGANVTSVKPTNLVSGREVI
jgi:hypothetical protein